MQKYRLSATRWLSTLLLHDGNSLATYPTLGTRGNFGSVLPVTCLAASRVVARCQGVPKDADLGRYPPQYLYECN
ncbi:MAG: hypothetical protein GY820_04820 [Gammaproteobacteria bacterium]|nr:hypothetical protein [Gammaproteobacteria bacterium]